MMLVIVVTVVIPVLFLFRRHQPQLQETSPLGTTIPEIATTETTGILVTMIETGREIQHDGIRGIFVISVMGDTEMTAECRTCEGLPRIRGITSQATTVEHLHLGGMILKRITIWLMIALHVLLSAKIGVTTVTVIHLLVH